MNRPVEAKTRAAAALGVLAAVVAVAVNVPPDAVALLPGWLRVAVTVLAALAPAAAAWAAPHTFRTDPKALSHAPASARAALTATGPPPSNVARRAPAMRRRDYQPPGGV